MNYDKQHYKNWKSSILLIFAAFIWGTSFVAQSIGMEYIAPFTFNGIRCILGGIVLIPCIFLLNRKNDMALNGQKSLWRGGLLCGLIMFIASNLQQFGIAHTTVGKAGFITALYIVIVPVLGIFFGKKAGLLVWIGVFLSLIGLYLLCMTDRLSLGKGDLYVLLCAFCFSIHIMVIDHYAPKTNGVALSCLQFFVCGTLSVICMLLFESPEISHILMAKAPLLYAGILSCGVAYTFQILGQKHLNPTIAALLCSLESVFSALAGFIILGQTLSTRELAGCVLMFLSIILAQL